MGRYLSVLLLGFSLLPFAAPLFGQGYPEGQVLVRLPVGTSLEKAQTLLPSNGKYKAVERLVPELGLFLVELRANFTVVEALQELRRANSILYAQADHYVHSRSVVPNDVDFGKQWNFLNTRTGADVSATSAWDFGTGGKDRDGKELVVAVVDGGMDTEHGELSENLWVNALEIDGNGIDDDGNGYVDDRHGWDAFADMNRRLVARASKLRFRVTSMSGDGDEGFISWTMNVEYKRLPSLVSVEGLSHISVRDGVVTRQRDYWDLLGSVMESLPIAPWYRRMVARLG